jgi:hypothetical protein
MKYIVDIYKGFTRDTKGLALTEWAKSSPWSYMLWPIFGHPVLSQGHKKSFGQEVQMPMFTKSRQKSQGFGQVVQAENPGVSEG